MSADRSITTVEASPSHIVRPTSTKTHFSLKTTLDWNHLSDSFVKCDSVQAFRSALESRD